MTYRRSKVVTYFMGYKERMFVSTKLIFFILKILTDFMGKRYMTHGWWYMLSVI